MTEQLVLFALPAADERTPMRDVPDTAAEHDEDPVAAEQATDHELVVGELLPLRHGLAALLVYGDRPAPHRAAAS